MTQRQQGPQPDFDLTGRIAQFNKFVKEAQQLSVEGYDIGSSILTPSSDSDPFLAKSSGPGESEQSVETVIQEIRSKLALPVDIDNSALAARLAGLLDDLHVAKERSESGAVAELEMKIIEAIPLALTLGDNDLCQICVYALGQLGEEAAEQAVEDSALVAATWQGTGFFERVQKMAHLSGHGFPFRRIVSVLSSPLKNRLYTYRPSRWVPPKSPAKTNLKTITTILHGTWSNKSSTQTEWWEPKGSFAQSLGNLVGDLYSEVDYFFWSGLYDDTERRQAAQDLVDWVKQRGVPNCKLQLICHSHGGNVALLAAQQNLQISKLVLLGTPIQTEYVPRIQNIDQIINIYSSTDSIQTSGANGRKRGEARTLSDTDKISNHPTIDPKTSHSSLHEWSIWTQKDNDFHNLL